jgi:hypothetical protein
MSDKNIANLSQHYDFPLILGFEHEEEFMILPLAVGLVIPLLLLIVDALSVSVV